MKQRGDDPSRDEACVFGALLALAVVGRWAEPAWHFTPLAAVTAFGGYYFRHWLPALLLPSAALALSDLGLPAHDNFPVLLTVHLMMALPLVLGRVVRSGERQGRPAQHMALGWALCGFLPATAFDMIKPLLPSYNAASRHRSRAADRDRQASDRSG